MTLIRRRLPEISNKQSAERLASLGDKVFAEAVDPILLLNHASYIRESSAKTLAKFEKFLTGQSLFIMWFQSSFFGLAIICRPFLLTILSHKSSFIYVNTNSISIKN